VGPNTAAGILPIGPFARAKIRAPCRRVVSAFGREYGDRMLDKLDRPTRLRLLRILAAAAWVDGEVQDAEREFFAGLIEKLPMADDERALALGYLDSPPHPAEADPTKISPDHRRALMDMIWRIVAADGVVADEEKDAVKDLEEILLA